MKKTVNHDAFLSLVLVVFLWGINSVSIKYLTQYFPPLALAPIRLCLASGLLLTIVFYRYGFRRPPRQAWLPIAGVALFCIFLHQIALTTGIKATSGTHAVIILGSNPLFTALLAGFFLKEPFTAAKGLGIALGISGLLFVVAGNTQGEASMAGDSIMFIATITFVIGSFFVKKATATVSPLEITAYSHSIAAIALLLLGLLINPAWSYSGELHVWSIAVLLFSSFISTAIGALLWNMAIEKVGASTASLFQNASPVVGVMASAFFLGEQLYWQHFAALTLVVLGVSFGTGMLQIPALLRSHRNG
ncbi:MAG: EamA family transporter [Sporomusaceae bacterium]|nr:EamA family transporter [Sporomusaceae bacterium]